MQAARAKDQLAFSKGQVVYLTLLCMATSPAPFKIWGRETRCHGEGTKNYFRKLDAGSAKPVVIGDGRRRPLLQVCR